MGFFRVGGKWCTRRVGNALRNSEDLLLKKITVANYRQDPYYAPIVIVVEDLLREKGFVAPMELFIRMNLLSPESAEDWRRGQIFYLERVIRCNLSKASRILRILRMHAHDLDLKPSLTVYKRWTKGSRPLLRFSKTGDHNVEEAYARHFVSPRKKGCPFEAGAIDVCNSAEISQARGASTRREIQEGQVQRSCKSAGTTLAHAESGKKVATLLHR
jgi:hypothetical protein